MRACVASSIQQYREEDLRKKFEVGTTGGANNNKGSQIMSVDPFPLCRSRCRTKVLYLPFPPSCFFSTDAPTTRHRFDFSGGLRRIRKNATICLSGRD